MWRHDRPTRPDFLAWGGSLGLHLLLLVLCSLAFVSIQQAEEASVLTTEMSDVEVQELLPNLTQEFDVWATDPDAPVVMTSTKTVTETLENLKGRTDPVTDLAPDEIAADPMAFADDNMDMDEVIEGIEGATVNTEGDIGSVDRITVEIIRELKKNKVLVAWLMDASESLRSRREQVIQRFDRVYQELDELADDRKDALLTSVIAFGANSNLMTSEPTGDRETITKAVRRIKIDESGTENIFDAARRTILEYRKQQAKGYKLLLVVLTDEAGDDSSLIDEVITLVKRHKVSIYVMGPLSPFGTREMKVSWTDPETKEEFFLPVDRGPESLQIETAKLPVWNPKRRNSLLSAGFGPYGLARLTRESGGIYFLYDDNNIPGPRYKSADLLNYSPDYISQREYQKLMEKSPLRRAILRVALGSQQGMPQPKTKFLEAGIQFEIRDSQKSLMAIYEFLERAASELKGAEKFRSKEASSRWLAYYDLLMGRILLSRIRLHNSVPLLNEMYAKPKVCKKGTTNAWELAGVQGASLLNLAVASRKNEDQIAEKAQKESAGSDAPQTEEDEAVQAILKSAREHLERVVQDHAGTPWATIALAELTSPLDFKWKEAFIIPPAGEKLPWDKVPLAQLTKEQKVAKQKFERFRREQKKKKQIEEKLKAKIGTAKRKVPKL